MEMFVECKEERGTAPTQLQLGDGVGTQGRGRVGGQSTVDTPGRIQDRSLSVFVGTECFSGNKCLS